MTSANNVAAARGATAHLLALGHSRVAAIGAQRGAASAKARGLGGPYSDGG